MTYDKQGNRVLWVTSQKSLVVQMNVKTWKVTPYVYANGSTIGALAVDQWTGDVYIVVDNVLVKKSYKSNSTDIWASGSNVTTLPYRDPYRAAAVMDRTTAPKCGLKSCKYLCVRSAKDKYECLCPQGYAMKGGSCEGNVLVATEIGRRNGEIFIMDPKRVKESIRVRLLVEEQGIVRHLEVDPVKGYIFWSRGCIKRADYNGANMSCIVNVTTNQFTLDPVTSRLCYVEKSGEAIAFFSVVDTVQSEVVIGHDKLYLVQRKILASNLLQVKEYKRDPSGNFTEFSSYNTSTTIRFRATAVYKLKSEGMICSVPMVVILWTSFPALTETAKNACSKNNGGCSHLCISDPHAGSLCLCAYALLQPDGSCATNPSFISYTYGGIIDFISISPNATVPRSTLKYPDIPRGITVMESDPDRNQLILVDRGTNRIIIFRFTTNDWYSVADGGTDLCAPLKCSDECRLTARGEPHCACRGERKLEADNMTCTGSEFAAKSCAENEFLCKLDQKCIPYEETCDRYPDCAHAEDEDVDMCRDFATNTSSVQSLALLLSLQGKMCSARSSECAIDEVACVKGERTTCISQEIICNQSHDCENLRYFAETMCGVNECKFDLCEEQCIDLPFAYRCECRPPKIVDPKNPARCIMGDQCSSSNCSQFCIEKGNGKYECACGSGFMLEEDKHGCKLKSRVIPPKLVSIGSDGIRLSSLRESYQTLSIDSISGRVLAYSSRSSSIYWIDEKEVVGRTFTNASTVLLTSSMYDPDGMAVDELSGNIYWTSKSRNAILMSDSENIYIKTVYRRGPGVLPYALAIDSSHRTMFWSDIGKKPSLNRMSIINDDRGLDVVLDSSLIRPIALAVDPYAKRLYWIDQALDYLGVCSYDGANRQVLGRKMGKNLYGLDVFGDFLYISDFAKGTIDRLHKLTAKNRTTVISGIAHVKGIQLVHPEKWPRKNSNNPCESKETCAQICVPTNTRQGYQCLCRDGMGYDDGVCISLAQPSIKSQDIDYATVRNFFIALLITTALVMLFFHKNRLYILATPNNNSSSLIGGQERYPLNIVAPDGGVENPVFESNEDTPMDPEVAVEDPNG
ncbi:EGF-like domain protein [Oesophagostomum dentatum]|uniref:EGF-like domain protein n=1 Tax=Oesophagostomum dentatum TaxID=61180 RepID=A0A0B1TLZ2_OESDE|nr:EGF-like domain protein [Oesophagostomum dentatum]